MFVRHIGCGVGHLELGARTVDPLLPSDYTFDVPDVTIDEEDYSDDEEQTHENASEDHQLDLDQVADMFAEL